MSEHFEIGRWRYCALGKFPNPHRPPNAHADPRPRLPFTIRDHRRRRGLVWAKPIGSETRGNERSWRRGSVGSYSCTWKKYSFTCLYYHRLDTHRIFFQSSFVADERCQNADGTTARCAARLAQLAGYSKIIPRAFKHVNLKGAFVRARTELFYRAYTADFDI